MSFWNQPFDGPGAVFLPAFFLAANLGSTTKGRVRRRNCSVGPCGAAMQQSASVVKRLIPKGYFASRVATKMHITAVRLFYLTSSEEREW